MRKVIKYSTLALIPLLYSFNAVSGKSVIKTLNGDDVDGFELKSVQVEGFETEKWQAVATPGDPELIPPMDANGKPTQTDAQKLPEVELIPKAGGGNATCRPQNLANDETNKRCLGVRFKFIYPGNNVVALYPPDTKKITRVLDELDHNNKPKLQEVPGLKLPGKVKAISVWVLGRGNDYTLEAWVQDWKGSTHILKMGSVNFVGWRPLMAKVPVAVPQDIDTYPQTKNLVLTKLVLRARPSANTEKVVIFFDSVKVLTDVYDVHFDGADVDFDDADKKEKNEAREYAKNLKKYTEGGK